mgnify:CR=1 FL=1
MSKTSFPLRIQNDERERAKRLATRKQPITAVSEFPLIGAKSVETKPFPDAPERAGLPSSLSRRRRVASRPSVPAGMCTVVSSGWSARANSISLKPTTDRSSGMARPSCRAGVARR